MNPELHIFHVMRSFFSYALPMRSVYVIQCLSGDNLDPPGVV